MLHLLCIGGFATTSVAGGATLSYNQLAGADAVSARFHVRCRGAAPLSSRPLGAQHGLAHEWTRGNNTETPVLRGTRGLQHVAERKSFHGQGGLGWLPQDVDGQAQPHLA